MGDLLSDQAIYLGLPLLAVTGVLLLVQALQQAPGMFLTWPGGLKFQSVGAVCATAVSLIGSVALCPLLGSLGPAISTSVGILLAQTIPGFIAVRLHLARRGYIEP